MPYKSAAARKAYGQAWYLKNREKAIEKSRAWQQRKLLAGLCPNCGGGAMVKGRRLCRRCIRKNRSPERLEQKRRLNELYYSRVIPPIRLEIFKFYGNGKAACVCCKEAVLEFLSIDHINNDGAKFRRGHNGTKHHGGWPFYMWLKANNFPPGFQTLCHNCNIGKHRNKGICPHKQKR